MASKSPSGKVLEEIVAEALGNLGFTVMTRHRLGPRGRKREVDVWGFRLIDGREFYVYASCKNWDYEVGIEAIDHEIGRIGQLDPKPHVKILVARKLNYNAKSEAQRNGFIVIELGNIASEDMVAIYNAVYVQLKKLFCLCPDPCVSITEVPNREATLKIRYYVNVRQLKREERSERHHYEIIDLLRRIKVKHSIDYEIVTMKNTAEEALRYEKDFKQRIGILGRRIGRGASKELKSRHGKYFYLHGKIALVRGGAVEWFVNKIDE